MALTTQDTVDGVFAFFVPQLIRQSQRFSIVGTIGVFVSEFEELWETSNIKEGIAPTHFPSPLFPIFITNYPDMHAPPPLLSEDPDIDTLNFWLLKIDARIRELPPSLDDIAKAMDRNRIGPVAMDVVAGNAAKYLALQYWLKSRGYPLREASRPNASPDVVKKIDRWAERYL
jgi:hypothetical protein